MRDQLYEKVLQASDAATANRFIADYDLLLQGLNQQATIEALKKAGHYSIMIAGTWIIVEGMLVEGSIVLTNYRIVRNASPGAGKIDKAGDVVKGAGNFGKLSKAGEYGIKSYNEMTKTLKGTGLQAHHVIEQRFGLNITDSVAVTATEHQAFTNAWRSVFKYGTDYSTINKTDVWKAAQSIYKDYPSLLDAARKALGF